MANTKKMDNMIFDRISPTCIDEEMALLASCMLPESALSTVADIIEIVKCDDFYKESHQMIYNAILSLYQRNIPPDLLMIVRELENTGKLEKIGGVNYLYDFNGRSAYLPNIKSYAEIVRDTARRRKLIATSRKIYNDSFDDTIETNELLDTAENMILDIKDLSSLQYINAKDIINTTIEAITAAYRSKTSVSGLSTGFKRLDYLTTGMYPGDYYVIAGRTSMGKSVFVKDVATHVAFTENVPVGYFTLETSKEQLMLRLISSLSGLDGFLIKTGQITEEDFSRIINTANEIYKGNLLIDDSSGLTDMELRSRIRRMKHEYNIGLVIVDYIGQLRSYRKTENRQQEVSEISRSLKAIAKDFSIPVIAVAQINRGPEDRSDKRPLLSDLRESGSLEMDADTVCLLYRDSYYNKNVEDKTTEIIVAKQRNGPVGVVKLDFNKQCTKFENQQE
jgi:replicative DNA helicase